MKITKAFKSRLKIALGLLLALSATSQAAAPRPAPAPRTTDIPEIRLGGLAEHRGKNLTVFYVSAREAALSASGHSIMVRSIKTSPVKVRIDERGVASVPKVSIPVVGFDVVNYLVFVVHPIDVADTFLRNPNGSVPADPRLLSESRSLRDRDFRSDLTLNMNLLRLARFAGLGGAIQLDAQSDF